MTLDTASKKEFTKQIYQGDHLCMVFDEVHRTGSKEHQRAIRIKAGEMLGLSATPERFGDPEGTTLIIDTFKGILEPRFKLKDAIEKGILCPYFYYPNLIELNKEEQEEWDDLTSDINKKCAKYKKNAQKLVADDYIKMLLIKRARILKKAKAKEILAERIIKDNYRKGQGWIIYCDDQDQLEKVSQHMGNNEWFKYHSKMEGDRKETLNYVRDNGGILLAIRCLDEGVDIPSVTHGLILASSRNPREFIQRRGRILRKHIGKSHAYLFDAIVRPNPSSKKAISARCIITEELKRAKEFAETAMNTTCKINLKLIEIDEEFEGTIEEGYESDYEPDTK